MFAKNIPVEVFADKLRRRSREDQSHAQRDSASLSTGQLIDIESRAAESLAKESIFPNYLPIIIDSCVDTDTSAKAVYHALGNKGVVLTYAMSDKLLDNERIMSVKR